MRFWGVIVQQTPPRDITWLTWTLVTNITKQYWWKAGDAWWQSEMCCHGGIISHQTGSCCISTVHGPILSKLHKLNRCLKLMPHTQQYTVPIPVSLAGKTIQHWIYLQEFCGEKNAGTRLYRRMPWYTHNPMCMRHAAGCEGPFNAACIFTLIYDWVNITLKDSWDSRQRQVLSHLSK